MEEKIRIHCKTQHEYDILMEYYDKVLNWRWYEGQKPHHWDGWGNSSGNGVYIEYKNSFRRRTKPPIDGSTFIEFSTFMKLNPELAKIAKDVKPRWIATMVQLNEAYSATVYEDKVKVGCSEFSFSAIEKLHSLVQQAKNHEK